MTRQRELAANRRLAELLGWSAIVDVGGALLGCPPAGQPACRGQAKVPDWMGDWRDCGPLMVAFNACRLLAPQGSDAAARAQAVSLVTAHLEWERANG